MWRLAWIALLGLTACGQKGDLYVPEETVEIRESLEKGSE